MNVPHRNNAYDNNGILRKTIILDKRQKSIDIIRANITAIEIELMEETPDISQINIFTTNIRCQLKEGFGI